MKPISYRWALFVSLFCVNVAQGAAWQLVWSDEFNGARGSKPDSAKWTHELGAHGFGNGELQCYTDSPDNVRMDGKGHLEIVALKRTTRDASGKAAAYSSGRIITRDKFSKAYGRFAARMKFPKGQGYWPAFWMLGEDIGKVGWPNCGEIDIMENIGKEVGTVHGTLHGPGYFASNGIGAGASLPGGRAFADDFHEYAIEWEPGVMRWYLDGRLYQTRTPRDLRGKKWVFDHPHFILLNLAIGGGWPGPPDATTRFPQSMLVDYVRVHTTPELEARAKVKLTPEPTPPPWKLPLRVQLPGRIYAVDFAQGGPEKAYHDQDPANQGDTLRKEGVDIQDCGDEFGKYSVGWTRAGEWMEYDVASKGGKARIRARVACEGPGGKLRFHFLGRDLGVSLTVPDTTGWQTWKSVESLPFNLPAGQGRLRVTVSEENAASQAGGNLFYFDFVSEP